MENFLIQKERPAQKSSLQAETGGGKAKNVFLGLGVGAAMKALFELAHLLPGKVALKIPFIKKAEISSEMSSALLGVGFILGPRIAAVMVGRGLTVFLNYHSRNCLLRRRLDGAPLSRDHQSYS